jgi:hypothetical protein
MKARITLAATCLAAVASLLSVASATAAEEFDKYDLQSASAELSSTQAGAHADFSTTIALTEKEGLPYALTRDITVRLPSGIFGNPEAFPKCSTLEFGTVAGASECPQDSQVGTLDVTIAQPIKTTFRDSPIYNVPAVGGDSVARFAFFAGPFPAFLNVRLDPETNTLIASVEGSPAGAELISATTTFWGVPGSPIHDAERLTPGESVRGEGAPNGGRASSLPPIPFMTNPTSCVADRSLEITVTSYQLPGQAFTKTTPFPQITGCALPQFNPSTSLIPTTTQATSGSGLDYELQMPTQGLQFGHLNYDAELKRAEVILPQGMTINPSQAEGLGVCSQDDLARERYDSSPDQGCPESSKIGSVRAISPVIDRDAVGSLYVAKPYENPFGSLIALYMVLKVPDRGVLIKLAGKVSLDPTSGQITTVFDDAPELPVASFQLHFREGARAPLVTPPSCGSHVAISNLTPNSRPASVLAKSNAFSIDSGPDHGPCPTGGLPPFHPDLLAGTLNNAAGAFSPFNVKLTRADSEQELTRFSIKLPPGVAAKLAGIPSCTDAQIAVASGRTGPHGGAEELADPSCPSASQIGRTLAGAGVGQVLAYAPGKIYLAGPYHGAPLSFVSITSGVVGPFDIGTVVVRLAIDVNPETGEVFLDSTGSDPIPHIIKGVTLHVRDIRAYTDRPSFTFNPTSCEPTSTSATVLGSGLDFVSAADDNPFVSTSPFQAADCAALPFKPKLTVKLKGATRRAGNPALFAHLEMAGMGPAGANEAGLAYSRVALPKTLFLDNAHIGTVCTRVQFKAGAVEGEKCPAGSIIGSAQATTPILDAPLAGPIYLRSNPERELPDIAASLQGSEISVVAVGHTDSSKSGGLRNTFEVVPDAPISSVDINLFGGKRGLIESSRNLCSYKPKAKVEFKGHNGKSKNYPKLRMKVPGCKKGKNRHHARRS